MTWPGFAMRGSSSQRSACPRPPLEEAQASASIGPACHAMGHTPMLPSGLVRHSTEHLLKLGSGLSHFPLHTSLSSSNAAINRWKTICCRPHSLYCVATQNIHAKPFMDRLLSFLISKVSCYWWEITVQHHLPRSHDSQLSNGSVEGWG
jgi:hypothetical protein